MVEELQAEAGRAVVTGASGGIGGAIALELLAAGYDLALVGSSSNAPAALEPTLAGSGRRTSWIGCDFREPKEVLRLGDVLRTEWAPLDVLVHAAGAIVLDSMETADIADLDTMLAVNLRAPVLLTQQLLPSVVDGGSIVFVNSMAGLRTSEHNVFYSASKHGLMAVANGLRRSLGRRSIRVLSVYPSLTATRMGRYVKDFYGTTYDPSVLRPPGDIATRVRAWILDPGDQATDMVLEETQDS
jgi:NAD(P)-dependent dehydrogenase (short-subunit alcohol dehydrogenase family)